MTGSPTDLFWPSLGGFYQAVAPWTMVLLRVMVGLAMVPHGLRSNFGMFASTGGVGPRVPGVSRFKQSAAGLARQGYWPSHLWAALVCFALLGAGPLLALGLFTRPMGAVIALFFAHGVVAHWRWGHGWFWNQQGIEYPLMWGLAALVFAANGGGPYSLDHLLFGWEF
jgi:putative oxidoreductase